MIVPKLSSGLITAAIATVMASAPNAAFADSPDSESAGNPGPEVGSGRMRPTRGYYWTEIDGESVPMIVMNEIIIFPQMKFRDKKEEEFYWRTVRDVKKALPYAKLICETLLETYEYIETFPTQKEREEYLKEMESAIFQQYKPTLKRFTKSQAKMLIKLINRETDQSSYSIIKAFLGSFRAGFWQTFGRFFGVNLKTDYKPESDRQDAIIERIAVAVEQGRL